MSDWIDINDEVPDYGEKVGAIQTGSLQIIFNMDATAEWVGPDCCAVYPRGGEDIMLNLDDITHWKSE